MGRRKAGVAVAIAIITIGAGWLLNNVGVLPAIEWLWTLGLAVTGAFVVAFLGFDKVTIVVGPFLMISSIFAILRQTGKIAVNYEIPVLVIILGALLLIAVLSPLRSPEWFLGGEEDQR